MIGRDSVWEAQGERQDPAYWNGPWSANKPSCTITHATTHRLLDCDLEPLAHTAMPGTVSSLTITQRRD